jgi:dephospho-CoA kinase
MERDTLSTLQAQAANQSKEQEKLVTDIIIIKNSSQFGDQYKEVSN